MSLPFQEPNEELQLDFAGPITDINYPNTETYILVTVVKFLRAVLPTPYTQIATL